MYGARIFIYTKLIFRVEIYKYIYILKFAYFKPIYIYICTNPIIYLYIKYF